SLVYVGVRQFFGLRPLAVRAGLAAALCIVAMAAMLYRQDNLVGRLVVFSTFTCVLMIATGGVVYRQRQRIQTPGVVLYVLLAIAGLALLHALRVVVY
ncbi:hypothetical protein LZB68_09025, partial [Campylobacter lari]|nr:hypothetical protein [Campylobacter lari]